MRLIYIVNARIPTEKAHGVQIMQMLEAFAKSNLEAELIIPRRFNPIKSDPFDCYNTKRIFKTTKLPCLDLFFFNSGKLSFFVETFTFLISAKIYLMFRRYDILYTREQFLGLFFKNFILEIHNLPNKTNFLHRIGLCKALKLVVLTSFLKNELILKGFSKNKILVAPDGADIQKFKIQNSKFKNRENLKLPQDKKIILYTGSFYLYNWKGVDVLLNSAKYFDENYLFVLVGGSDKEIKEIKIKFDLKNVLLISHRPYFEIPAFLQAADVLVLPNNKGAAISEKYTSPLKMFEYMASGTPIIASDLPSIKEVLNENNSCFFNSGNAESLANAIRLLLNNDEFGKKLAMNAFEDVKNYTWEKRAEKILNFINDEQF